MEAFLQCYTDCLFVLISEGIIISYTLHIHIFNDISYCLSPFLTVSEPEMLTKYFFDDYLDFVHKVIKPKLMLIWNNSV